MLELLKGFGLKKDKVDADEIAAILKTSPENLKAFEKAYETHAIDIDYGNLAQPNATTNVAQSNRFIGDVKPTLFNLMDKITKELYDGTMVFRQKNGTYQWEELSCEVGKEVTLEEIQALPFEVRPQLTKNLCKKDIGEPSSYALLQHYADYIKYKEEKPKRAMLAYHQFRQGLDILDIDSITYEILGCNRNSIGNWFPELVKAQSDFFKIPETKIIKVPQTMLQLARIDFAELTPTSKEIVNSFCRRAFELDATKKYFIKTGTYSSKFDFRNAKITEPKEVMEIGEYLIYLQFSASMMAGPLSSRPMYGASTTNEWVVREYIEDKEDRPTIYKGLPLRCEYRVFADFDSNKVIGVSPYWDEKIMENHFSKNADESIHDMHDLITFKAGKDTLVAEYETHREQVVVEIEKMLPQVNLSGQWSIDIMKNGDEFYIIDMAIAENSALYHCVPEHLRIKSEENWIPTIPQKIQKKGDPDYAY